MSELMLAGKAKVPAYLKKANGLAEQFNADLVAGLGSGFPRISIRGSRFRVVVDGQETTLDTLKLRCVVLAANPGLSKTYYEEAFTPDDSTPPDCASDDGIRPNRGVRDPQSSACATCPQNVWGSKITPQGTQVKACADSKRIAIIPADSLDGDVFGLTIPAASLRGLRSYANKLASHGVPPLAVITELSFDSDAAYPLLVFTAVEYLDEDQFAEVSARSEEALIKQIIGLAPSGDAPPALDDMPAGKPPAAPKKKAKKPVVEEVDEDEADEEEEVAAPKPKAKKKAKKPAPPPVEEDEDDDSDDDEGDDEMSDLESELDELLSDLD